MGSCKRSSSRPPRTERSRTPSSPESTARTASASATSWRWRSTSRGSATTARTGLRSVAKGDYLTSPEVSPVFGAMVGRQLRQMWEAMGSPSRFDIVEAGAGNGTLCRDILAWATRAAPEMLEATRYTIVEPVPALETRQRSAIGVRRHSKNGCAGKANMPPASRAASSPTSCSTACPVHRVAMRSAAVYARFTSTGTARGSSKSSASQHGGVRGYFERLGLLPGEGCRAEVNLAATDVDDASRRRSSTRLRPHVRLRLRGDRAVRALAHGRHAPVLLQAQPEQRPLRPHRPPGHDEPRRLHDASAGRARRRA